MKKLDLIYFNAGGGHRAAAMALEAVAREQQRPWQIRCVNLVDMLDPAQRFRRLTGFAPEDFYNKRLASGWTLGLAQELKLLQGAIQIGHDALVRRLQLFWQREAPDMVVSLIPNFNRALVDSVAATLPGVPYVTVLTDMADHPPNFWFAPGPGQDWICGTQKAVDQALAMGCDERRIHRSSGMIIRPDFYHPTRFDRRAEQARLGLDPDRPTGVVMFGGQGSMAMVGIARALADVQLVLMCGRHQGLARKLRAMPSQAPHAVVEFTPEVRRHLMLGDFFVGKPGPGCLSEAVHQGLPIVTVRNAWTMPQERYNADWVLANGLGLVTRSMRKIRPAVMSLLARLDQFKADVSRIENRAVFDVAEILAGILDQSGAAADASAQQFLLAADADFSRPAPMPSPRAQVALG